MCVDPALISGAKTMESLLDTDKEIELGSLQRDEHRCFPEIESQSH